jgi:hypothetical protein
MVHKKSCFVRFIVKQNSCLLKVLKVKQSSYRLKVLKVLVSQIIPGQPKVSSLAVGPLDGRNYLITQSLLNFFFFLKFNFTLKSTLHEMKQQKSK